MAAIAQEASGGGSGGGCGGSGGGGSSSSSTSAANQPLADPNEIPKGLAVWREAVGRSQTSAQIAMCLYSLESSIAWDKSIMKAVSSSHVFNKLRARKYNSKLSVGACASSNLILHLLQVTVNYYYLFLIFSLFFVI